MKIKKYLFLFLFFHCFWPGYIYAAPAINNLSGSLDHGEVLIIEGYDFGNFATEQIWDDFEDGTADINAKAGRWERIQGLKIDSSTQDRRHENSFYQGKYGFGGGTAGFGGGTDQYGKWYASYWFKLDPNWVWGTGEVASSHLSNVKFFRIWHSGSGRDNWVTAIHTFLNGNSAIAVVENCGDEADWFWSPRTSIPVGSWNQFELEYKESSSRDSADGISRIWFNGKLVHSKNNWITRCSENDTPKRMNLVGFYNSWGNSPVYSYWQDDSYVVNSWSRVIVGNAADCGSLNPVNCNQREIQPINYWGNSSISINFNQGSFNPGQTAYLYVVDENGNVNENGYPITIGGNSSVSIPGDLNSDGVVNIFDYNIFLQNFGNQTCGNVADLNDDCSVNIFDYNILLENFGRTD
jgi:hypothetical protein